MRINKDIPLFPSRFNEIRPYLKNDDDIDYDSKYTITKRVSKNIKTREDGGSYSHLHAARCYFNPVSC
uniref:PIR Superfamily Protein n=1 Tax=Strongyloides papillosus TaxID=174720 RepID=A0A0N5B9X1_STREA